MPIIEEVEERRCHLIEHNPVIIVQAVGTPCKLFLLMPETVINYNPCPSSIHRKSQFLPSHQMSDATVKRYFSVTYIHYFLSAENSIYVVQNTDIWTIKPTDKHCSMHVQNFTSTQRAVAYLALLTILPQHIHSRCLSARVL